MTNTKIIEMAREAGFKEHNGMVYVTTINDDCAKELKAFAALVASLVRADAIAEEREACAKVCEAQEDEGGEWDVQQQCANAIRARGETK